MVKHFTEQQLRQQGYTEIYPITALLAIRRAKERLSNQNEVSDSAHQRKRGMPSRADYARFL